MIDDKRGIVKAIITTAIGLTEEEKRNISLKLEKYSGKEVASSFNVDNAIKGGFIARIDALIINEKFFINGNLFICYRKGCLYPVRL
jgi:F0F1-type ATP synthase delta subunit